MVMETSPFEPSVPELARLASNIASSLKVYELARDPSAKAAALRDLTQYSKTLTNAATNPVDAFSDFTFQPLANACVRVAISMELFEKLRVDGVPVDDEELARLTGADIGLVVRVTRALAAFDIIRKDDNGRYAHTPLSRIYADESSKAWAVWMWFFMTKSCGDISSYFEKHSFRMPKHPTRTPFTFAHGTEGMDVFEVLKETGKLQLVTKAMSGSSVICAKEAVATYDFNQLEPGENDVLIVDVGGSKGQTIKEIKTAFPGLKGRMIVQDLEAVLDGGLIEGAGAEAQAYDFFTEFEPTRGAAAYFYQRIFHDWSDDRCRIILRNLISAMGPRSKLLISDIVVEDHNPHPRKALRDMNMLLAGGMERSETQWRDLLESEGFRIEKVYGLHNINNSIIEAVLR